MFTIFKGDTANNFIKINLNNIVNMQIAKLIFQCGKLQKVYENPTFPLYISFTRDETKLLNFQNVGYVAIETTNKEKYTAKGYVSFKAKLEVVQDV